MGKKHEEFTEEKKTYLRYSNSRGQNRILKSEVFTIMVFYIHNYLKINKMRLQESYGVDL